MKKWYLILISALTFLLLAACSNSSSSSEGITTVSGDNSTTKDEITHLKVGASSIPHAELLEYLAEDIEKDGVTLDITVITDAAQTNQATADGQLDFNFFQHNPFMNQSNEQSGLNLVNVGGVHIEPFGVYSKEITTINDLPVGAKVAVPQDVVNFSRALLLFASQNIIELDPTKKGDYTEKDIIKNEKKIQFIGVDSALLNRSLDDTDAAAINTNYALEGGLNPIKDALIIEDSNSPYVNIVVTAEERKDDPAIQTVVKWLTSEKAREFIESKYDGAVVPAF